MAGYWNAFAEELNMYVTVLLIAIASQSIVLCPHFKSHVSESKWCNLFHIQNLSYSRIWKSSFPASVIQEVNLEGNWNVC